MFIFIPIDIRDLSDWYRVKVTDVTTFGGSGLYDRYKSLFNVLAALYPEYLNSCKPNYTHDTNGILQNLGNTLPMPFVLLLGTGII